MIPGRLTQPVTLLMKRLRPKTMPHPHANSTTDSPVLRLVFWETTAGCNLECIHCRRLDVSSELMQNDLTTTQSLHLIDSITEAGKPILVLSGGEPLFRPDIFEIAAYAKKKELPVALATNGTLINEAIADQIVASGIRRVSISIDGADITTHDQFRNQPGSLEKALHGFSLLKSRGMSMQINCTITRHNLHQLDQLYQMALNLGADALHLFMLVPVGCGVEIAETNMLPAAEYENVLNWVYDRSQENKIQIKPTCAPHYFRIVRQRGQGSSKPVPQSGHPGMHTMTKGCLAGSGVCFISHSGEVYPCGYLPVSSGNILQHSFKDIWMNSPVFKQLRSVEELEGKCGICEFNRICMGCRARAFSQSGNYMGEEPYCTYKPKRKTNL